MKSGTIMDATIIGAPGSTKNADNARDPEMHQTRKGRQWYFGMKLHIGVASHSGLAHSAVVTAANVHDKHPLPDRRRPTSTSAPQRLMAQVRPCSGNAGRRPRPPLTP